MAEWGAMSSADRRQHWKEIEEEKRRPEKRRIKQLNMEELSGISKRLMDPRLIYLVFLHL